MNVIMSKKRSSVAYLLDRCTQKVYDINSWACIGRNKTADICIINPAVSRSHACLQYHANTNSWTVTDTGSTLGTRVNNMKLIQDEAVHLKYGDEIQLADLEELTFKFFVSKISSKFKNDVPAVSEMTVDNENVNENIGGRHNLQSTQDRDVLQLDENKNKLKEIGDNFRVQSEILSNKFDSQKFHMNSQSEDFKKLEKTYKEATEKLKIEMETEIQNLRLRNEELLTRLDVEERLLLEQTEKIKQAEKSEESAQATLTELQKENEEKAEEIKRLKVELKHKIKEIEKKNLEKTEELNSLKEDLKLAVSKSDEIKNALLTAKLEVISNCIESEVQCSICSEMMIEPAVINCGHMFCEKCISEWLKKKINTPVCPMCRLSVLSMGRCTVLNSLLESVSESLPPLKRKRLELLGGRTAITSTGEQSTSTSSQNRRPEESADVFAFSSNITLPSGSGQRTVTGPVDHIDLTLDDSVVVQVLPPGQQVDLTAAVTANSRSQQDRNVTAAARTRRNSIPRNRSHRGRFRRSSNRR